MKKNKAFTFYEVIISVLLFLILSHFIYVKYTEYIDNRNIQLAKNEIIDNFLMGSILALKNKEIYKVEVNFIDHYVLLKKRSEKKELNYAKLPNTLEYYTTDTASFYQISKDINENGNISKSFTIYIFDSKKIVRARIAIWGFDEKKFLKIYTYKYRAREKIKKKDILEHHEKTLKNKQLFQEYWQIER